MKFLEEKYGITRKYSWSCLYNFNKTDWELTEKSAKFPTVNTYPAKVFFFNFQPLEVVSRYRDPQPQVVENYSIFFNSRPKIYKSLC